MAIEAIVLVRCDSIECDNVFVPRIACADDARIEAARKGWVYRGITDDDFCPAHPISKGN